MSKYEIRKSTLSDLDSVMEIFVKVTDHMLANGIDQWNYDYPSKAVVLEDLQSDNHFVLCEGGKVVGTMVVDDQQDEQYRTVHWKNQNHKVMVIHRLAVDPKWQGKGIGRRLCEYAEKLTKSRGYYSIRLDAYAGNEGSNILYQKLNYQRANGFCYFRKKAIPFYCYEKSL